MSQTLNTEIILHHLQEISRGICTINEDYVLKFESENDKMALIGLMFLFEDLKFQKEKIQKLEKQRSIDAMIVTYNHEIRNPLSIADGILSRLAKSPDLEEKERLEKIKTARTSLKKAVTVLETIKEKNKNQKLEYTEYQKGTEMVKV